MINIIADSLSGIPVSERAKLGIPFVSQFVIIDGKSYRDSTEIDTPTLLKIMKSSPELPKTAAPMVEDYLPLFRQLAGPGDTAIVITPSRSISGTYRSAWVARQEFPEADIRIIDSQTISGSLASLVLQALFWVKQGWDADRITTSISNMASRERTFFLVDTLEYMRKGGRIGGAAALVGTLMGIKPILTLRDGQVEVYEKIRSKSAALDRLKELVEVGCPRTQEAWLCVTHCSAADTAKELANHFKTRFGYKYVPIFEQPPAIVVNTGPNVISVNFFVEA